MRTFWFFTTSDGNAPHFPPGVVPRRVSRVAPIRRLEPTAGHAHLWAGIARPDARLSGEGALHFHDVIFYAGNWHTLTTGATPHSHGIPETPTWWLVCAALRDVDVAACAADPQMFNIGEIVDGDLAPDTWSPATLETWQNRIEAALYLTLPDVVNSPPRFVVWLLNVLGLQTTSERAYRCPTD